MVLTSNAFYGETANGNWTVKVVDADAGVAGALTAWSIKILGHAPPAS